MPRLATVLAAVGAVIPATRAILSSPGSQCATNCGNVLDRTNPDDLVCDQKAYSSATGQLFSGCVDCQRQSTYYRGNDSDTQAMLYNIRYSLSYCLWGDSPVPNEKVSDTPCITSKACGPFKDAVEFKNLSTAYDAYQYCEAWPVDDAADFKGCTDCLQAEGRRYLANFVITLQAGCEQKPPPGFFIGLDGEIFSSTQVNITTPSPTASVNPEWFDKGPLNLGAKVGIAVGGFVVLLMLLGCCIVFNGKRKRRAYLRDVETRIAQGNWPSPNQQREMGESSGQRPFRGWDDTPISQRPLNGGWNDTPVSQQPSRGWDESPMTATGEKPYTRYFSPYSSQFNSPVSAQDALNISWPHGALAASAPIGIASGGETDSDRESGGSDGKGKARQESYELHEVSSSEEGGFSKGPPQGKFGSSTPVLSHPGQWRGDSSPPQHYVLTDQDARSGNAI